MATIARLAALLLIMDLVAPHALAQTGSSQNYPNKPIRLIVPYAPGVVLR